MSVEAAFVARLRAFGALPNLVANRIHPHPAPDNTPYPHVTFQRVSGLEEQCLDGPLGVIEARFQFNSFSRSFDEILPISEEIREALAGYNGTPITGGTVILDCYVQGSGNDLFDKEDKCWYRVLDFEISYRTTRPNQYEVFYP